MSNTLPSIRAAQMERHCSTGAGSTGLRERLAEKLSVALARLLGVELAMAGHSACSDRISTIDRQNQMLLCLAYRSGDPAPRPWREIEFRSFSPNGEDGVLLYLLSQIGMDTRRSVELGCGDGVECNTANLVVNHGYSSLMIDPCGTALERGRGFYASCRATRRNQPQLVEARITRENVDDLITKSGFAGPVDVLSVNLHGLDYWVWAAIRSIRPRVVAIGYDARYASDDAVALRYDAEFHGEKQRSAVSLAALVDLGRRTGYRFVGCEQQQSHAFFVRDGLAEAALPEVDPARFVDARPLPTPESWVYVNAPSVRAWEQPARDKAG